MSQGKLKNLLVADGFVVRLQKSNIKFQIEEHRFSGVGERHSWNFTLQRVEVMI